MVTLALAVLSVTHHAPLARWSTPQISARRVSPVYLASMCSVPRVRNKTPPTLANVSTAWHPIVHGKLNWWAVSVVAALPVPLLHATITPLFPTQLPTVVLASTVQEVLVRFSWITRQLLPHPQDSRKKNKAKKQWCLWMIELVETHAVLPCGPIPPLSVVMPVSGSTTAPVSLVSTG